MQSRIGNNLIYLDRQIVIHHYERNDKIIKAVEDCKKNGYIFPYSSAQVEEISSAYCSQKRYDLDEQISHLEQITGGVEIIWTGEKDVKVIHENVKNCLQRVKEDGGRKQTIHALDITTRYKEKWKESINSNIVKIQKRLEKTSPENVFMDHDVLFSIDRLAREENFRLHINTHQERLIVISTLFDILEFFGYRKEYNIKRYENKMHDISHAIYASYCNYFVTDDKKLYDSCLAIYKLLKIKTIVLSKQSFIEFSNSLQKI